MTPTFTIPQGDVAEFAALPEAVRKEIRLTLETLRRIWNEKPVGAAIEREAVKLHVSAPTLRRRYDRYRATGDWKLLKDRRKAKGGADGEEGVLFTAEFLVHWRTLCGANKRTRGTKAAWRTLVAAWRRGEAVPGYAALPLASPVTGLPEGWSYKNLLRHALTKFEAKALRQGLRAAADYRLQVRTTRVGGRVGELLFFDDMWHDCKVNVLGHQEAYRPLEFAGLDWFSGCRFAWGIKARIRDQVTGKAVNFRKADFPLFLLNVLCRFGYRTDERGTTLGIELGTTALDGTMEKLLLDHCGIRVMRGGVENRKAHVGQWGVETGGNFRAKALLEGNHDLAHNYVGHVRGQVGMNPDHAPEELAAMERENTRLLKAALALPPEAQELLAFPFPTLTAYLPIVQQAYAEMNARIDHEIEGYEEAGLVASEYRLALDLPWQPHGQLLLMPPESRAIVAAAIQAQGLTRARKLSPGEVYHHGSRELTRMPDELVAIFLTAWAEANENVFREEKVKRTQEFYFDDSAVGPGTFYFEARVNGRALTVGETFLVHVNPFNADLLFVFDARKAFVGVCRRRVLPNRMDRPAMEKMFGQVERAHAELRDRLVPLGERVIAERIEDMNRNAALLAPSSEERTRAKQKREADKTLKSDLAEFAHIKPNL